MCFILCRKPKPWHAWRHLAGFAGLSDIHCICSWVLYTSWAWYTTQTQRNHKISKNHGAHNSTPGKAFSLEHKTLCFQKLSFLKNDLKDRNEAWENNRRNYTLHCLCKFRIHFLQLKLPLQINAQLIPYTANQYADTTTSYTSVTNSSHMLVILPYDSE